jgi:hypothetical protein
MTLTENHIKIINNCIKDFKFGYMNGHFEFLEFGLYSEVEPTYLDGDMPCESTFNTSRIYYDQYGNIVLDLHVNK